jgi:hypothetical protein
MNADLRVSIRQEISGEWEMMLSGVVPDFFGEQVFPDLPVSLVSP